MRRKIEEIMATTRSEVFLSSTPRCSYITAQRKQRSGNQLPVRLCCLAAVTKTPVDLCVCVHIEVNFTCVAGEFPYAYINGFVTKQKRCNCARENRAQKADLGMCGF